MLYVEEFLDTERTLFSLQRYFSLDKGILKYSKCLNDVSITGIAEGTLMFVLDGWLYFPEASIFVLKAPVPSQPRCQWHQSAVTVVQRLRRSRSNAGADIVVAVVETPKCLV